MVRIQEGAGADILCFGHTPKPYDRDERPAYRRALNIGSVGKLKDGDMRACYVGLDIRSNLSVFEPEALGVNFIRVPYDVEKSVRGVLDVELPAYYAQALLTAH